MRLTQIRWIFRVLLCIQPLLKLSPSAWLRLPQAGPEQIAFPRDLATSSLISLRLVQHAGQAL